jgi:hypothetical protein
VDFPLCRTAAAAVAVNGTANYLAMFTAGHVVGNPIISQDNISNASTLLVKGIGAAINSIFEVASVTDGGRGTVQVQDELGVGALALNVWGSANTTEYTNTTINENTLATIITSRNILAFHNIYDTTGQFKWFTRISGTDYERMTMLNNGFIGINSTNPLVNLQITGLSSTPAITGTTPNGTFAMINSGAGPSDPVASLYVGSYNDCTPGVWMQSAFAGALGTNYPIYLNPLGGGIGIGVSSVPLGSILSTLGGVVLISNNGNNLIALNSVGTNYGYISNPESQVWDLGYGPAIGTLGTSVLKWTSTGQVGIGGTPRTSCVLDLVSTTGALCLTVLTDTERNALTPLDGMIIFNSSASRLQFYTAGIGEWKTVAFV